MSDLDILIQEIARIALEDEATTQRIAHELGETEEELQRVAGYLNSLLDPTENLEIDLDSGLSAINEQE